MFEEDLRSKHSFDELLLTSIHNDVSFREGAKKTRMKSSFRIDQILSELT